MDSSTKRRLVEVAAKYNFLLLVMGVCLRPLMLPVNATFVFLAFCCVLLYGAAYYLVRRNKLGKYAPLTLFASTFMCITPFLVYSGGVHSHIVYLIPLISVFAGMILSERSSWVMVIITSAFIIAMGFFIPPVGEPLDLTMALPKMVWLILTTFVGTGFARFFSQENRQLADTLNHQANLDYLTKVLNRRGMEHLLDREADLARNYGRSLCIFMIDLDHFKKYNDNNGHIAGDSCLSTVSQELDKLVCSQRGSMGRYGGEEFIAVLPERDADFCHLFAETLRRTVNEMEIPLKNGQPDLLTASVGYCYRSSEDITDIELMIARADAKLYQCKDEGRNRVKGDLNTVQSAEIDTDFSCSVN